MKKEDGLKPRRLESNNLIIPSVYDDDINLIKTNPVPVASLVSLGVEDRVNEI